MGCRTGLCWLCHCNASILGEFTEINRKTDNSGTLWNCKWWPQQSNGSPSAGCCGALGHMQVIMLLLEGEDLWESSSESAAQLKQREISLFQDLQWFTMLKRLRGCISVYFHHRSLHRIVHAAPSPTSEWQIKRGPGVRMNDEYKGYTASCAISDRDDIALLFVLFTTWNVPSFPPRSLSLHTSHSR